MLFKALATVWMMMLFVCFIPTVIVGSLVQIRVANKHGWRVLRERPFFETRWKSLTAVEKSLIWPGLIMFFLMLFGGTIWKLIGN